MKKIIAIFLSFTLMFSSLVPIFAAELENKDTIEIPVYSSYEEFVTASAKERDIFHGWIVGAAVVRISQDERDCELMFNWSGNTLISQFRFKKARISSTSLLSDTTYATFGSGVNFRYSSPVVAAVAGTVTIGEFKLSLDVDRVKISVDDLQIYSLDSGAWRGCILTNESNWPVL